MGKRTYVGVAIATVSMLALVPQHACASGITVTNNINENDLASALTSGGAGGITITKAVLSSNSLSTGQQSSGLFTTNGPNNYNLTGSGVVLSNGNAADLSSGPVIPNLTTQYNVPATTDQFNLLKPLSPLSNSFNDVTQLTITFNADANTSKVFFGTVFASAEYPVYVGQFVDAFGLYLNGKNVAFANGQPVNIDNSGMVDTSLAENAKYQETALQGLLVGPGGIPYISYGGDVTPGSTGNTLTFIIADANDARLDTAVFISGLGNAPPPGTIPEPSSLVMLGIAGTFVAGLVYRARRKASA